MFTAQHARNYQEDDLDERIEDAVKGSMDGYSGTIRFWSDRPHWNDRVSQLEMRGFTNVSSHVGAVLTDDVYFEWGE